MNEVIRKTRFERCTQRRVFGDGAKIDPLLGICVKVEKLGAAVGAGG